MELYSNVCLECSKLVTKRYSTSFSRSVLLLDPSLRSAVYAIYGFVRLADEVVDTFHSLPQKDTLNDLRSRVFEAIEIGASTNPLLHSFQLVVNRFNIPHDLIHTFLHSMEMDLYKQDYSSNDYKKYIDGSAEVVGLMCLMVFCNGKSDLYQQLSSPARSLGSALQKVNFLRDMRDDYIERGRVYFPNVNFESFSQEHKRAIENDIQNELNDSMVGIRQLPKGAKAGVYLAYLFFSALLNKIKGMTPQDITQKRVRINNLHKVYLFIRAWLSVKFSIPLK